VWWGGVVVVVFGGRQILDGRRVMPGTRIVALSDKVAMLREDRVVYV